MEVTGKCHCGHIRYRAKINPERISLCHCTDCQTMSGSAYRVSAQIPLQDFELLSGQVRIYVKTADSGEKRVQAFCPECATPLYAESLENPKIRSLRIGAIEQRAALRPRRQIWCRSALRWTEDLSQIEPKFEKSGTW